MILVDAASFEKWRTQLSNEGISLKDIELTHAQYDELLRSAQHYMTGCGGIDGSPGEWFRFMGVTIRRRSHNGDIPLIQATHRMSF